MNCPKCGNELKPGMKFCAKCGTPVQQPAAPVAPQQPVQQKPVVPAQQKPVVPAPSKETAQPAPKAEPQKPEKQKKAKKKGGKKNVALRVIAIILVIAVLATGGIFITDAILFKSESEKAGYITDFPVLKQDTEFLIYDAEKFPYENYNIKVDRLTNGTLFKSSAFNKFENVINEKSDSKIFNLHLDDGKYQITIENIVSERTQAPSTTTTAPTTPTTPTTPSNTQTTTTTAKTEEPVVITIIVIVDNDDEDAVDKVTINSKKDDEPIKEFDDVTSSQAPANFIEATDSDFEKLGEMLRETVGAGYYGDDKSMDSIEELLCLICSSAGSAYRYYYGDIEYKQYTSDYILEAKVPKENIKWICENIFNIEYKETLDYSGMNWNDSGCYFKDDYLYISDWTATAFPYSEYELDSYKLTSGKYEAIFDVYEEDWSGDHDEVYAGTVKVTAEIKIIDGKRYWSIYKIEEYDPSSATPPTQAPTQPTQPTQTPAQSTQTPSNNTSTGIGNVKVGDYVKFGKYEQDNNTSNGAEDIEWLVLDVKDGKALVISKYALDAKPYNEEDIDVTWETCTLRKWLNNDFINTAFTNAEKAKIPTVTVSADKNPIYDYNPGNATQDKAFLLNITEVDKYFSSDEESKCAPTDYAKAQGVHTSSSYSVGGKATCHWWLRSPVGSSYYVCSADGLWGSGGVCDTCEGVRPAMWINIG